MCVRINIYLLIKINYNETKKDGPTVVDSGPYMFESAFSGRPYMVL